MTTTPVVNLTHDLVTNRAGTVTGWFVQPNTFRTSKANDFTGRVSMGSPTHSDMDTWLTLEFTDWSHGVGAEKLSDDPARYLTQDGWIEAAIPNKIKLAPQWRVSDSGFDAFGFADYGNYCFAGGTASIRKYNPSDNSWADSKTGLGGPVMDMETFNGKLYVALGDTVDMESCTDATANTWATVTGHKARCLKKCKELLWCGNAGNIISFDGTATWTTKAVGDPKSNVLWLAVQDTLLIIGKDDGTLHTYDGTTLHEVISDFPPYSGNFRGMRTNLGWLYYSILSSIQRVSGLGGSASLQNITPINVDDDTFGFGLPVGIASSTKYVWVLFDRTEDERSQLMKYSPAAGSWHPAYISKEKSKAHSVYYSRVAGYLFFNDGNTHAQRYTTLNDEGYADYPTDQGHTLDFLHVEASLAEIVKAWKDVIITSKGLSATEKVVLSYQLDQSGEWKDADTAIASPQATLSLSALKGAVTAKDIQFRLTLYTGDPSKTPEVNGVFVRYLPRPDAIYSVSMVLELEENRTLRDGTAQDTNTIAGWLAELRELANAKTPVLVDTMDDLQHRMVLATVAWSDVEIVEKTEA